MFNHEFNAALEAMVKPNKKERGIMNKLFRVWVVGTTAALALGACNKSSDDAKQEAANVVKANTNPAIKSGTYSSPCSVSFLASLGALKPAAAKTVFEVSSLDFKKKQIYYDDTECKREAVSISESGKLEVVGSSRGDNEPLSVRVRFDKTSVYVNTEKAVAEFNAVGMCGHKDWAAGENNQKVVTAEAARLKCPGKVSPRETSDLILVKDNKLFLGGEMDQDANKGFPSKVDDSKPYQKI